ncbi:hypothetical protein GCM10020255_100980 [Rhodococcus baikonurensis]
MKLQPPMHGYLGDVTEAGSARGEVMTVSNIWILGGYQSDFARNFTREELDFANLAEEVVNHTRRGEGSCHRHRGDPRR